MIKKILSACCCCAVIACNPGKQAAAPLPVDVSMLSGYTFYNADTSHTLTGLSFINDSLMEPLYSVCFDTIIQWKYKVANRLLYRYAWNTNDLIAKDSIINLTDRLLELRSFTPDTDRKFILNREKKVK